MGEYIVRETTYPLATKQEVVGELVRCKDCRWWDEYDETLGYCMAAKHCHLSEHWEICIRRTYKDDFYCADAERREDE